MAQALRKSRSVLHFSTRNASTATSHFRDHFDVATVEIRELERPNPFSIEFTSAILGASRLFKTSAENAIEKGRLEGQLRIIVPLSGELGLRAGGEENIARAGQTGVVIHPYEPFDLEVRKGKCVALQTPERMLFQRAESLAQSSIAVAGTLARVFLLSTPASAALVRNLQYVIAELRNLDTIGMSSLVLDSYEETILNLAAAAVYPFLANQLSLPRTDAGLTLVLRARDYLQANAEQPIDVAALASEFGLSLRSLQEKFQETSRGRPKPIFDAMPAGKCALHIGVDEPIPSA